jgi:hypothetical protein
MGALFTIVFDPWGSLFQMDAVGATYHFLMMSCVLSFAIPHCCFVSPRPNPMHRHPR